jgi:hypothetical protein
MAYHIGTGDKSPATRRLAMTFTLAGTDNHGPERTARREPIPALT